MKSQGGPGKEHPQLFGPSEFQTLCEVKVREASTLFCLRGASPLPWACRKGFWEAPPPAGGEGSLAAARRGELGVLSERLPLTPEAPPRSLGGPGPLASHTLRVSSSPGQADSGHVPNTHCSGSAAGQLTGPQHGWRGGGPGPHLRVRIAAAGQQEPVRAGSISWALNVGSEDVGALS